MQTQKQNLEIDAWETWNKSGWPKYPHEKVIQFTLRNFGKFNTCNQFKALDLGCGSGINTNFLASLGFQTYGVDISGTGIKNTTSLLKKNNLHATSLEQKSIDDISFEKEMFDLIISVGVFDSAGIEITRTAVPKALYSLKRNGICLFIFASSKDYRNNIKLPFKFHGYEEEEVISIFNFPEFKHFYIDRYITTYENNKFQQNDFLITCCK